MWQHKPPDSGAHAANDVGKREYISVVADYAEDGTIRPVSVRLADGPAFAISRVIGVTDMSTTKRNGAETRFHVRIGARDHYLFFEDIEQGKTQRWYILE